MSSAGGHLQAFVRSVRLYLFGYVLVNNLLVGAAWWLSGYYHVETALRFGLCGSIMVALAIIVAWLSSHYLTEPYHALQQGILHIAPTGTNYTKPAIEHLRLGRELTTTLLAHVYQLANVAEVTAQAAGKEQADLHTNFIAQSLPLPLLVLNHDQTVLYANESAERYLTASAASDLTGQNLNTALNISFQTGFTLDSWLQDAQANKPTAVQTWERVKIAHRGEDNTSTTLLFDLAAFYNRDNQHGYETVLVLFDHTAQYSQDDQAISLIALGVHELRTPLTLLRGYIEAFEVELDSSKLSPDLQDFMRKMDAAARQLTTFVNNILKVARIDEDEFVLQLHEEQWSPILTSAIDDMRLRASVRGITLVSVIADSLPLVGADRTSMYEVVTNLIDNAIKYSGDAKEIRIATYVTKDGLVETTVQDFGIGIPEGSIPNLFDKFYRNHRHRSTISGTGLGLYLAKTMVGAHDGNIWVRSKEGQGSTFGFTLQPYDRVATKSAVTSTPEITRSAHGWIKNHSLYRR